MGRRKGEGEGGAEGEEGREQRRRAIDTWQNRPIVLVTLCVQIEWLFCNVRNDGKYSNKFLFPHRDLNPRLLTFRNDYNYTIETRYILTSECNVMSAAKIMLDTIFQGGHVPPPPCPCLRAPMASHTIQALQLVQCHRALA